MRAVMGHTAVDVGVYLAGHGKEELFRISGRDGWVIGALWLGRRCHLAALGPRCRGTEAVGLMSDQLFHRPRILFEFGYTRVLVLK